MKGFVFHAAPLVVILGIVAGCKSEPPGRDTPEGAFARLAPCVDAADAACLMEGLDRDSRWSVHTIHRTLRETREIVERSYPADEKARQEAFGSWGAESAGASPHEMFRAFCARKRCLHRLARGFGAVVGVEKSEGAATVKTSKGESFPMYNAEGEWGLSTYRDELLEAKIRLADNLKQVRLNGAAYEEQRVATGGGKGE